MQRYFIDDLIINNNEIIIPSSNSDYHHITNVMRMKKGDQIYICNNKQTYLVEINNINKNEINLLILKKLNEDKCLPYEVCIAQGLVRKEKMEEVIDGICQMGASSYIGVEMERSLVKLDRYNNEKMIRMRKISKEASEQSHRNTKMEILDFLSMKDFLKFSKNYDLCLYAYERSTKDESLKNLLKTLNYQKILVLIGPEGGFSENEVKILNDNSFHAITLGSRILRTEMAPIFVMASLVYEWEL